MKYKMVVADFDWTLGVAPNYIDEKTIEAIKLYQNNGGKFVVCTGRILCSILQILRKYSLKGEVIACQGAVIADIESGKVEYINGIEANLAAKVIKQLIADGEYVLLDFNDRLCYNKSSEYTEMYEELSSLIGLEISDLAEFVLEKKTLIQKVMCMCDSGRVKQIIDKYQKEYEGELLFNSGSDRLVEVVNPKCSKGLSTVMLAKKFGIKNSEVLVMGDSLNDISLMEYGFYGVAVGNACDELKLAADETAVDFRENPVLQMLEKYCL